MTAAEAVRSETRTTSTHIVPPLLVVGTLSLIGAMVAWLGVVGSDALWLAALGDNIREHAQVPVGVPFAAAPTQHWVNTTVLGQLVFSVFFELGSPGILLAQLIAVVVVLGVVSEQAVVRGAAAGPTAIAIALVAMGAAAPLLIARAQLLSLVPFTLLVVLMRRQHDKPDARIWWTVPLIAVWGNLHGAVLVGVAVLGCYLLMSRLKVSPVTAIAVGAASLSATCLNPGFLHAPRYYINVLGGQATSDESGMWGRLNIANPFDVLLIAAALLLVAAALRRRRPHWEYAVGFGLLAATASSARHGVWLLLFIAVPAALGMSRPRDTFAPRRLRALTAGLTAAMVLGVAAVLTFRAPSLLDGDAEAKQIAQAARGQVVLAPEPFAESLAVAGATIWAGNPLDAFTQADQAAYLAFIRGDAAGAGTALNRSDAVVAVVGSPQMEMAEANGFSRSLELGPYVLLHRG